MIDTEQVREDVRAVVAKLVRRRIADDQLLLSSGLIDSLSVLRLISGLESELQITIPKNKVQPDDFDSVNLILETLQRVCAS